VLNKSIYFFLIFTKPTGMFMELNPIIHILFIFDRITEQIIYAWQNTKTHYCIWYSPNSEHLTSIVKVASQI